MKLLLYLLTVLLMGCSDGGKTFVAPTSSAVTGLSAELYGLPDEGSAIPEFQVDATARAKILNLLNGAKEDRSPFKWVVLGDLNISTEAGDTPVELFMTYKKLGAFKVDGSYYRGASDSDFKLVIREAYKRASEQGTLGDDVKASK